MLKPTPVTMNDYSTADLDNAAVTRNLGKTDQKVGQISVFIRELFQNSWDARLSSEPVGFGVEKRTIGAGQFRSFFGIDQFDEEYSIFKKGFDTHLGKGAMKCVLVSDRNTTGLTEIEKDEKIRWDNFMNLGVSDTASVETGGNFGLGKTVCFKASEIRTIAVYTRYKVGHTIKSRFIGISMIGKVKLGMMAHPDDPEKRKKLRLPKGYAGKIIWSGDGVSPLENGAADAAALALGIGKFEDGQTGTDILIFDVQPLYEALSEEDDSARMGDKQLQTAMLAAFCWSFWPRLMIKPDGSTDLSSLDFKIDEGGGGFDLDYALYRYVGGQNPLNPVISEYIQLRSSMLGGQDPDPFRRDVTSYRPSRSVGSVVFRKSAMLDAAAVKRSLLDGVFYPETMKLGECLHHVALMRGVGHVVTYAEDYIDAEGALPGQSILGLFVANQQASTELFALAEGPAHDSWTAQEFRDRGGQTRPVHPVKQFERSLKEVCDVTFPPPKRQDVAVESVGSRETGEFLNALGLGTTIGGPSRERKAKDSPGAAIKITSERCAIREEGRRELFIDFEPLKGDTAIQVKPSIRILGEFGKPVELAVGDGCLLTWFDSTGKSLGEGSVLSIPRGNAGNTFKVEIRLGGETRRTKISATLLAEELES